MDEGLAWLGLGPVEVRVFVAVVERQEISSKDLTALLHLTAPAVSRAVGSLRERGLVRMTPHRRPALVYLSYDAHVVLGRLKERAEDRAAAVADSLTEAEDLVADAVQLAQDRGQPLYERAGRIWQLWHQEGTGAYGHDEVHAMGPPRRIGRGGRLLIATADDPRDVVCRQRPGTEVRRIEAALPRLMILDRERVASVADGVRTFWSYDARHVRAAQDLFELWWARAGEGVLKPATGTESRLDDWEEFQGLEPDDPLHRPDEATEG